MTKYCWICGPNYVPGDGRCTHTLEQAADPFAKERRIILGVKPEHNYMSTACQHDLHDECRGTCKFCDGPCHCYCHRTGV